MEFVWVISILVFPCNVIDRIRRVIETMIFVLLSISILGWQKVSCATRFGMSFFSTRPKFSLLAPLVRKIWTSAEKNDIPKLVAQYTITSQGHKTESTFPCDVLSFSCLLREPKVEHMSIRGAKVYFRPENLTVLLSVPLASMKIYFSCLLREPKVLSVLLAGMKNSIRHAKMRCPCDVNDYQPSYVRNWKASSV